MRDAGRWALEQLIDDSALGEMKLSIFKDVDAPISVREEGMQEFLYGVTKEAKQTYFLTGRQI